MPTMHRQFKKDKEEKKVKGESWLVSILVGFMFAILLYVTIILLF